MVSQRFLLSIVGLTLSMLACGGQSAAPAASPAAGGGAAPAGSPAAATPTAQLAKPAASPSPSPAAASPAPGPVAAAASPSPVAGAPPASGGALYRIVSERSEARYLAREKFVDRPLPNDAIGTTKDVTGEVQLEQPNLLRGRVLQIRVDLRTLASDSGRRDRIVRDEVLQTDQYPYAEFRSTEVVGPTTYQPGEEASFQVPGMMKIRDQERPLTWDVRARLDGDELTGTGTASLKLTDFGIEPPHLAVLTVEDAMRWEVQFSAERTP